MLWIVRNVFVFQAFLAAPVCVSQNSKWESQQTTHFDPSIQKNVVPSIVDSNKQQQQHFPSSSISHKIKFEKNQITFFNVLKFRQRQTISKKWWPIWRKFIYAIWMTHSHGIHNHNMYLIYLLHLNPYTLILFFFCHIVCGPDRYKRTYFLQQHNKHKHTDSLQQAI